MKNIRIDSTTLTTTNSILILMIFKYIIIEQTEKLILFSRNKWSHKEAVNPDEQVKSAGFCSIKYYNNNLKIVCYGSSETLNISSNPKEDELIIRNALQ